MRVQSLGSAGSAADLIAISAATNATPIVITVGANSGLKSGDRLAIAGVTGNTAANGEWTLAAVSSTTFQLLGSVGNGVTAGTIRAARIFDSGPPLKDHAAAVVVGGNLVGTILITSFGSYAEFAANDNSLLGSVPSLVVSNAVQGTTNVNATSASSSTKATSTIVMAATMAGLHAEAKLSRYVHAAISAFTSGTAAVSILA